ncbi:hypothetical protein SAMN05421847_0589 [Halpernia humi]|uniref:Pentapeptide MXKDX repeat protein n=1 Tax=Halpernia humi TaxID=493375 RepID=A0A1H5TVX2_9FLAO|nr:hypothetical protein [Halpernia humi]SEF66919.1 hypothetical protein SAMN05421847_0589 [Halpernia humi]
MKKIISILAISAFTFTYAQETPKKTCCAGKDKKECKMDEKKMAKSNNSKACKTKMKDCKMSKKDCKMEMKETKMDKATEKKVAKQTA